VIGTWQTHTTACGRVLRWTISRPHPSCTQIWPFGHSWSPPCSSLTIGTIHNTGRFELTTPHGTLPHLEPRKAQASSKARGCSTGMQVVAANPNKATSRELSRRFIFSAARTINALAVCLRSHDIEMPRTLKSAP